jgi:hypothetical protein
LRKWSEPISGAKPEDGPLRGADTVNDGELEIGFDETFERRFLWVVFAGRLLLSAVVIAGLLGLLGRGPFSHSRRRTADGAASIDFEPVARFGTATQVTFHLLQPANDNSVVTIWIASNFMEPMGLRQIEPQPRSSTADGGGQVFTFAFTQKRPGLIRLLLKPSSVGPIALSARFGDSPPLAWTQWVLP